MIDDSAFNRNAIAFLMEATDASIEDATLALEDSGGNMQKALELLTSGDDDVNAPSVGTGTFKGAKMDDGAEMANDVEAQLQDTASAVAARANETAASVTNEGFVPTPRPPQVTTAPGAFAVEGPDARGIDDEHSITSPSDRSISQPTQVKPFVTARLVDNSVDLEERIRRQERQIEELQRRHENIVVGQVLVADNNNPDEDGNEEEQRSVGSNIFSCAFLSCSMKKVTIAVVLVMAVLAIIVGSVVATSPSRSLTQSPTSLPIVAPTLPPTTAPTSTMPGLIELLSFVSLDNGTALQMQSTPQNNALKWLANNTNLGNYTDKRKIQRYALAVFYYSTNGDNWSNNTGWLNNENECEWYIQPNNNTLCGSGDVVNLDFIDEDSRTDNNLDGTLPYELALLSASLRRLDLGRNNIKGSIPTEIGLMATLSTLWLYSNSLTGQIPSEIGKLTALTTFSLRENSLTGSLPSEVGSMTSLTGLSLWSNSLIGPIPSEIKSLTSLTSLSLRDNNFTGEFVCPTFIDVCHISCIPDSNDTVMEEACRSL